MANITTYAANKMVDHLLGTTAYTFPSTVYVALFTEDPTTAGTQTSEVTGAAYARQAVDFDASDAGASDNTAQIAYTKAGTSEDWGTITHFGIMDALTAGNMLAFGALLPIMHITDGMQYLIAAGALDVSITLT